MNLLYLFKHFLIDFHYRWLPLETYSKMKSSWRLASVLLRLVLIELTCLFIFGPLYMKHRCHTEDFMCNISKELVWVAAAPRETRPAGLFTFPGHLVLLQLLHSTFIRQSSPSYLIGLDVGTRLLLSGLCSLIPPSLPLPHPWSSGVSDLHKLSCNSARPQSIKIRDGRLECGAQRWRRRCVPT